MPSTAAYRWNADLWRHGAVILRGSRLKWFLLCVICIVFTAVAIMAIVNAGSVGDRSTVRDVTFGSIGLVLFGVVGIPLSIIGVFKTRLFVRVDSAGVTVNDELFQWNEITEITTWINPRTPTTKAQYVVIALTESGSASHTNQHSFVQRLVGYVKGGRSVWLGQLKGVRPNDLAEWMSYLHSRYTCA